MSADSRRDANPEPALLSAPRASADQELASLRQRVTAAVTRACPLWLAQQAEDIVQNVMVQLTTARQSGEGAGRFSSTYLRKAAYGHTVDEIRRRCRHDRPRAGEELAERAPSPAPDPEREAASAEIGRGIRACLLGIVRARRLAVTLYLQGCSVPEAARRLGWTPKKAENLVYRGLRDLRRCLSEKGLAP